jgi:hypothetical protein
VSVGEKPVGRCVEILYTSTYKILTFMTSKVVVQSALGNFIQFLLSKWVLQRVNYTYLQQFSCQNAQPFTNNPSESFTDDFFFLPGISLEILHFS